MSIYTIQIGDKITDLSSLSNQYIVIVNIASACGFRQQIADLQALEDNEELNCKVIAFPCNQFGNQQTIDDAQMPEWCEAEFQASYLIENCIDVNGTNAHPLFTYLKEKAGGTLGDDIKWNYTKFVICPNERAIKRFAPQTSIEAVESFIRNDQAA